MKSYRPPLIADRIYNRSEAALACGVAYITIIRAVERKELGFYKQGRRILHSGQHLLTWLKRGEVPAKEVETNV